MQVQRLKTGEGPRGMTHVAIISYGQGDFSAAATTQTYTLATLASGDLVGYPLAFVYVKTAVTGITTPTIVVGHAGDTDFLVPSGSIATAARVLPPVAVSAAAGGAFTGATNATLQAVVSSGSENWSAATAGEIHIFFNLNRINEDINTMATLS